MYTVLGVWYPCSLFSAGRADPGVLARSVTGRYSCTAVFAFLPKVSSFAGYYYKKYTGRNDPFVGFTASYFYKSWVRKPTFKNSKGSIRPGKCCSELYPYSNSVPDMVTIPHAGTFTLNMDTDTPR